MPLDHQTALRQRRHQGHTTTTYRTFLHDVMETTGLPDDDAAERALLTVLCAFERRLFGNSLAKFEAQLPSKLREKLASCPHHRGMPPQKLSQDELLQLIALELGIPHRDAASLTCQILSVVRRHVSEGEIDHLLQQLPQDLRTLWYGVW